MASAQLQLIDTERPWKLDRRTVEIGRAGLAQARAALAAATEVSDTPEIALTAEVTAAPEVAVATLGQQQLLHQAAA